MWRLHDTIQHYAWGSRDALARLRGHAAPTSEPEAELWMGAHPRAPSRLEHAEGRSLLEAIEAEPALMLGAPSLARFGPRLPFLLKVLAAAEPLSLQAHPDAARAREGCAREDAAGLPRDAPDRSYRDPFARPELVCALGPFTALCGFRDVDQTRALVDTLAVPALRERAEPLWTMAPGDALAALVGDLLTLPRPSPLVDAVVRAAAAHPGGPWARERAWAVRLGQHYPGDPGVVVALLLNLVELRTGEALYLSAGRLHCYLQGTAVEIMGSSDNVLRGGLTPKHVDVPELLQVLDRQAGPVPVVRPQPVSEHEAAYPTPAPAFALSTLELRAGQRWSAPLVGPELVLCTAGRARLHGGSAPVSLGPGQSAFVPGSAAARAIDTDAGATLFRATVGSAEPE
ncbi:MAG: mannose-6-phosphate isomerase, class I [Myxococcales bacterium]|nr:mannose-6-phosphate isomerase, class I [Myxococcales bacterium]